jgi:hypothetical protein
VNTFFDRKSRINFKYREGGIDKMKGSGERNIYMLKTARNSSKSR